MPVWTITRSDGELIDGFVCGRGGAGVAKLSFKYRTGAMRCQNLIASRDPKGFENGYYVLQEVRSLADHLELDEHCPGLLRAIVATPWDETAKRVLADRLYELGIKYDRAYREVHKRALGMMNPCLWPTAEVEKLLRGVKGGADRVRRLLAVANGNRKVRTVNMSQALDACYKARQSLKKISAWMGWHVAGGTSYRSGAITTALVVAVASNGKMRVAIGTCPAGGGWNAIRTHLGIPDLSIKAVRDEWVNRDEVAVWSVGVGAQNTTRFC